MGKFYKTNRFWALNFLAINVIVLHIGIAVLCLWSLNFGILPIKFFTLINLDAGEFFSQLFVTGLFFYFAFLLAWNIGYKPDSYIKSVVSIFALSFAISILLSSDKLSADKLNPESNAGSNPGSISQMIYELISERHALLLLIILSISIVGLLIYYSIRTFLKVEYSGTGIEISLPGQTMYYLPVYPQISWQDTGIRVQEGQEVLIELSGYVSPGALQQISSLENHMRAFIEWQRAGSKVGEWEGKFDPPTWPYTNPEGYKSEWYHGHTKLPILSEHPNYQTDDYYKQDDCLTIRGLTHNKVVCYIKAEDDPEPLQAGIGKPAYNWENPRHKEQLICISRKTYPYGLVPKKTGDLWVVINDVDVARWDNGGLFFLKVTKKSWK